MLLWTLKFISFFSYCFIIVYAGWLPSLPVFLIIILGFFTGVVGFLYSLLISTVLFILAASVSKPLPISNKILMPIVYGVLLAPFIFLGMVSGFFVLPFFPYQLTLGLFMLLALSVIILTFMEKEEAKDI